MKVILLVMGLLSSVTTVAESTEPYQQEVEQLITALAQSGCDFERNGSRHSAADAADHMRLKLRRGGKYVISSETFIARLASKSSWTGKAYMIDCPATKPLPSADWLRRRLAEIRAKKTPLNSDVLE
jgi:histidinol phosphatase-like PHP family hydrolase